MTTRRSFIRSVTFLLGTGALPLLAACQPAAPAAAPTQPVTAPAPTSQPAAKPVAAPTQQAPAAAVKPSGTITYATNESQPTLDPHFTKRGSSYSFDRLMFEGLVAYDNTSTDKVVPRLATAWTLGSDHVTWTFKLRPNVKFHDGTPFNAESVKFSFDRLVNPATGASELAALGPVSRVEVVDGSTVNVVTKTPFPELLTNLANNAASIMSPTAAGKGTPADFGRAPVGTGPFRFKDWLGVDAAAAEPNPDYWGAKPAVGQIVVRTIPEPAAIIAALEAGEVDIATDIPPDDVNRLKGSDRVSIKFYTTTSTHMIGMLNSKAPFSDVRVRKALNYAVNREAIVQAVFGGLASVQTSPVFPGLPYHVDQPPYTYDQARAKQLLADAGFDSGLKITLLYPTLGQVGNVSQAVAEDYRKIGVELELQPKEQAIWGQLARAHDDVRDMSYNTRAGLGIDFNLNRMFAKSAWDEDNRSRYFNPQIEDLLVKGRSSFDEKVRADTYAEIQRIVWDEAPEVFMFSLQVAVGANPKLANFTLLPNAYLLLAEATKA